MVKCLCKLRSQTLLHNNTNDTTADNSPRPRVCQFRKSRPEAVFLGPPSLQLLVLVRVLGAVARLLAFFVLPIAADKTQEGVICQGTEKDEGVERVGGIEENKREVNEGVTQVTEQSFSIVIQTWVAYPKRGPTLDVARRSTLRHDRDQPVPDGAIPTVYQPKFPSRIQR